MLYIIHQCTILIFLLQNTSEYSGFFVLQYYFFGKNPECKYIDRGKKSAQLTILSNRLKSSVENVIVDDDIEETHTVKVSEVRKRKYWCSQEQNNINGVEAKDIDADFGLRDISEQWISTMKNNVVTT